MKVCPKCGLRLEDHMQVCPRCNHSFEPREYRDDPGYRDNGGYRPAPPQYAPDPFDHTHEFAPQDVSRNKVFALAGYLLGFIGIVIALLYSKESPYLKFHIHQAMKITVTQALLVLVFCIPLLGWLAGWVCSVILYVVQWICVFRTASGKSMEVPILKKYEFLK